MANETFQDKIKQWRAASKTGPCWALVIAKEVCDVADHWDAYKAESVDKDHPNGQSPAGFLRDVFGKGSGLAWWRRRAQAVDALGEWVRRTVDHNVAVWVVSSVPADKRAEVGKALMRGCRENGGNPLTKAQAQALVRKIIGPSHASPRRCARCAQLEEILRANGIVLDMAAPCAAE